LSIRVSTEETESYEVLPAATADVLASGPALV
jgi:hypothetical protein